ncbi:MAG: FliG C-terminal domain-containing protein [Planctomycetota bacterium]|jgi:flagellar motor switch protein FliG
MGKRKAAMLLMSLDAPTAAELLKGVDADALQEIAIELALLDSSGRSDNKEQARITQEFCNSLRKSDAPRFSVKGFLNEMLVSIIGKNKAEEIQSHIRKLTEKGDPFIPIRSATTDELVLALEGAHPQTIAVVLSELGPQRSQEVLALLDEDACTKAVCKMTSAETVGAGVKQRIAAMVSERLGGLKGEKLAEKPEKTLRKLAVTLSGLDKELRDRLLDEIGKQDKDTSTMVRNLMITWEDIPSIADRSLQESLRGIDAKKLAVALYGASEEIVQKIRSNISERAAATVDEEMSLMQDPLEKEILDAREEVVKPLREANEAGTLRRVER